MSTLSRIYVQIVFAVQGRENLIHQSWENDLYKYITGIVQNKDQKMLAINGMPDHIHIFIGMKPTCCLSDLVRDIKKSSTQFIREQRLTKYAFSWQKGYGTFTYSHSHVNNVCHYIQTQKEHHRTQNFKDEYLEFLKDYEIDYEEKFVFQ